MKLLLYTDGASRGNPGESGIGVVLSDSEGNTIDSLAAYIGKTTNNIAEYIALLAGLQLAKKQECNELVIHADSELMVRQLQGKYKVRNEGLKHYFCEVEKLIHDLPCDVVVKYIPREQNTDADALANRGIDEKKKIPDDIYIPRRETK